MATQSEENAVVFSVSIDTPADQHGVRAKVVADTVSHLARLLAAVEKKLLGANRCGVEWTWEDISGIDLTARVNGVNREELGRIVEAAESGFEAYKRMGETGAVAWPSALGKRAQQAVRDVVRGLAEAKAEAITVQASMRPEVTLDLSDVSDLETEAPPILRNVRLSQRRSFRSAVEGILDVISIRGNLKVFITEHGTGKIVRCSLSDQMFDEAKSKFGQRVVASGLVRYKLDGSPATMSEISGIAVRRSGGHLEEFIGAAPGITGDLSTAEFLEKMRPDE